jgi:IS30 family transposase
MDIRKGESMNVIQSRRWSDTQKAEFWKRWKAGETMKGIASVLSKSHPSVFVFAARHGGIPAPVRERSALTLSLAEREEISRGVASSLSDRQIAARLGRAPSTVSRELSRNGGREQYRAAGADERAWAAARRPKACRLASRPQLRLLVAQKLALNWSPEQIDGWLKIAYSNDPEMQVSHETIYRSLFLQARGVLKKELIGHLRRVRVMRHAQTASAARRPLADAVSIRERPAEIEDRAVPGHWEGDLICGANNSHIATLVERQSRFTMLVKVSGKDTATVVAALKRTISGLPLELRRSLTWDRGSEMTDHQAVTLATDIAVYFCDPQSPWQRGTNENTNGLLRQYFPKGTDLSGHSQAYLNRIALQLNTRPRKTLGFKTPADKLQSVLH